MSDVKHTPGPWLYWGKNHAVYTAPSCPVYRYGYEIFSFQNGGEPNQHNLNVVLAAPCLLADLREAAQTLRKYESLHLAKGSYDKAEVNGNLAARFEATIAKAEGRTV